MKNFARFFTGMAVSKFGEKQHPYVLSLSIHGFSRLQHFVILPSKTTHIFSEIFFLSTLHFLWLLQVEPFLFKLYFLTALRVYYIFNI